MIESAPYVISILFMATTLLSIVWFCIAAKSTGFTVLIILWTILQTILSLSGVYNNSTAIPPKLVIYGIIPTIIFMILAFSTLKGKAFIDGIPLKTLTYFHSIRIPVEIVLALLFHQGLVAVYMTYEGTNFDILSGITAPIIALIAFRSTIPNKKLLWWWNIICLTLLLNVVITAIFAIPSPFQKLSLHQPNVAVLFFPFSLLPTVIVPMVIFAHLVAFRKLKK